MKVPSQSMFLLVTPFSLQVSVLKKKQDAQAQLLRQKQKSDEAAKRLQDEIQRIKTQKVQLYDIFNFSPTLFVFYL